MFVCAQHPGQFRSDFNYLHLAVRTTIRNKISSKCAPALNKPNSCFRGYAWRKYVYIITISAIRLRKQFPRVCSKRQGYEKRFQASPKDREP